MTIYRKLRLYLPPIVYCPLQLITLGTSVFLVSNPYTFIPMCFLSLVSYTDESLETTSEGIRHCHSGMHISLYGNEKMNYRCYDIIEDDDSRIIKNESFSLN